MLPTAKMLKTKLMGVRAALGWQQLLLSLALGQDSQGTPCCDVLGCPCHPGRPLLSCSAVAAVWSPRVLCLVLAVRLSQ